MTSGFYSRLDETWGSGQVISMLVPTMAAGWDDRLIPRSEDKLLKAVAVIGCVGDDLRGWKATDQVAFRCCIVLLPRPELEADQQAERIDYPLELAAEAPCGSAESLGLRSPFYVAHSRFAQWRASRSGRSRAIPERDRPRRLRRSDQRHPPRSIDSTSLGRRVGTKPVFREIPSAGPRAG